MLFENNSPEASLVHRNTPVVYYPKNEERRFIVVCLLFVYLFLNCYEDSADVGSPATNIVVFNSYR